MNESRIKSTAPSRGGLYELRAFGDLVYIGSTNDIQRRLLEHLSDSRGNAFRYKKASFLQSPTKMEREALGAYLNKHGELPRWNDKIP
jgi:predicted GIY-YIG superfamily endonuclease